MAIKWTRVASGDYEARREGRLLRLYRLPDVNPPAWNVEDVTDPYNEHILVDGAASKRDAAALVASAA